VFAISAPVLAQSTPEQSVLFTNVMVWDGTSDTLRDADVLVTGNKISQISAEPLAVIASTNMTVIDGGGRTLMPGLIDSHVHFNMMVDGGPAGLESKTWEEIGAYAVYAAQEWLQNGFTTARDMCGMHHGLRKAIDKGLIAGPRLYLSGGCLSQTSGHGDFRHESGAVGQFDREKGNTINLGITRVVDGRPEVLAASRANFAGGADYLKMMIGGGVSSEKDPLHSIQFAPDEVRAAVEAAEQWDTYVAAHVYRDAHIQRGLDLGIKVFDHAQFISEKTARNLKKKGACSRPDRECVRTSTMRSISSQMALVISRP
jgi:imidazolonepropionase-like amidohydrolase